VRLLRSVLAVALLVAVSVPAAAQTSGKFKFVSGNPYPTQPTLSVPGASTYYTSIYRGQFLSGGPTTAQIDIFCVDFFRSVGVGNEWNAWFSPLSGDLSKTYGMQFRGWDQAIAAERYRAAAWLATQFGSPVGGYDDVEKAKWRPLQAAIWSLMGQSDDGSTTAFSLSGFSDPLKSSAEGYLNTALAVGNTTDFIAQSGDWTVISDMGATATSGKQEFLTQQSVVPEPETVILLVTGLLALGAVAYFRGFSA
jgi:hypothetical protein